MTTTEIENSFVIAKPAWNGKDYVLVLPRDGGVEFKFPEYVKYGTREKMWKTRKGAERWLASRIPYAHAGWEVKSWKEVF